MEDLLSIEHNKFKYQMDWMSKTLQNSYEEPCSINSKHIQAYYALSKEHTWSKYCISETTLSNLFITS